MDLFSVKVILALAVTWGVPAKHGDIHNACVKADKEAYLGIYLQLPSGMSVSEETLRDHGAATANKLVKSLYKLKQVAIVKSVAAHASCGGWFPTLRKRHVLLLEAR